MDSGKTALVIRGAADQLALAEKFIENVDKAKPEVVAQVSVAEARVDKMRNLGSLNSAEERLWPLVYTKAGAAVNSTDRLGLSEW